jgi:hypothetical protein
MFTLSDHRQAHPRGPDRRPPHRRDRRDSPSTASVPAVGWVGEKLIAVHRLGVTTLPDPGPRTARGPRPGPRTACAWSRCRRSRTPCASCATPRPPPPAPRLIAHPRGRDRSSRSQPPGPVGVGSGSRPAAAARPTADRAPAAQQRRRLPGSRRVTPADGYGQGRPSGPTRPA